MAKQIDRMPLRAADKNPNQGEFNLLVDRQVEQDGIGMGVLRDGTPFLNQRGLARLCGVENRYIGLISAEWNEVNPGTRTQRIRELLEARGEVIAVAAHETYWGKKKVLAYPDSVCMAILEYYAFEAGLLGAGIAQSSYRRLARFGLRQFIYSQVGYREAESADVWRIFKDRVSLTYDAVPDGFFGVFKELADIIVTIGQNGLHIDENFVPDVSVGQAWSRFWEVNGLEMKYGPRRQYSHRYPPYFPQAASNPQKANCYPEDALGEFRRWVRKEYIGEGRFKRYLAKKVGERMLPEGYVERALLALTRER